MNDGTDEKLELEKRGISPQDVFNPKKSVTLREDDWEVVHEALAYMFKDCQDKEIGRVMDILLNQL